MRLALVSLCVAVGVCGLKLEQRAPTLQELAPQLEERTTDLEERSLKVRIPFRDGSLTGRSLLGIETFSGIPYADAPVGPLRLRPPQRLSAEIGHRRVLGPAPACPQMFLSHNKGEPLGGLLSEILKMPFLRPFGGQEDCLTVTVQRPVGTKAGDKLPVLFWIYGGGFQFGATNTYDAVNLLQTGVRHGQPFVFVAVNYRVNAFGFLGGAEVLRDGSANLGLLDQRMALEWVADNIDAFGGDAERVTIWGESAGAISVFNQMVLYGGNATYRGRSLFRGAIMNSGGLVPTAPVDSSKAQDVFNSVARHAGCEAAADVLVCLRGVSYDRFLDATISLHGILSYNALTLPYIPRPDGVVLPASPDVLLQTGRYHAVPTIVGNQEDEGTLFSLLMGPLHGTQQIVDRLARDFFFNTSKEVLTEFVDLYKPNIREGSPFRTGIFNELYWGYKRVSAILGDVVFILTRRLGLSMALNLKGHVAAWSYLASYGHGLPFLGTFHASDVLRLFYDVLPDHATASCRTYYLNFLYNLDPNVGVPGYRHWPQWAERQELMWFKTPHGNEILRDDFRSAASDWMGKHLGALLV
ncbi:Carboxylic ester hydrolase [Ophiocordyceps camponoti-floridani]|uniref:Carboxylic ester hydrolase n=1 Tax=Ophiocordyceps camponoti-floridani TaxID=2030778 RepID=A0A8H4QD75_9HYPO|nr:Carboxylic ester hydrolase [Ophiocordyceps camponoti-floridani]